jgi:hypothetical protein
MRLALLFHLTTLYERATISLIPQDILILFQVFLLDTQGHIARTRMQAGGGCGNCSDCTQAEEQARLRAAQEAARELEAIKTEKASHLCTVESIHPVCPRPEQQHILHASPPRDQRHDLQLRPHRHDIISRGSRSTRKPQSLCAIRPRLWVLSKPCRH